MAGGCGTFFSHFVATCCLLRKQKQYEPVLSRKGAQCCPALSPRTQPTSKLHPECRPRDAIEEMKSHHQSLFPEGCVHGCFDLFWLVPRTCLPIGYPSHSRFQEESMRTAKYPSKDSTIGQYGRCHGERTRVPQSTARLQFLGLLNQRQEVSC